MTFADLATTIARIDVAVLEPQAMIDRLIDFVISCLRMFQFWVVIYPNEQGLRLRLGKLHSILNNGPHWCIPFKIDRILAVNVVLRTLRLGAQSLVTADARPVIVNAVITCRVQDVTRTLYVHSIEHVVDDACSGLLASFVTGHTFEYLIQCCSHPDNSLIATCRLKAAEFGIEIINVQFTDVSPSRTIRLLNTTPEAVGHWIHKEMQIERL